MQNEVSRLMLTAALNLAELGYSIFPVVPGEKRPLCANGLLDATTDAEQVEAWWEANPTANIGLRTDGLLVVDVDGADNPWLADQPERLLELAAAPMSRTPRGGRHYVFRQPKGLALRNTTNKLAPKVDTRADGGYILVAPSVVNGVAYQWVNPLDCSLDKLPEPPAWLLASDAGNVRSKSGPRAEVAATDGGILEGGRNAHLTSVAGVMRRKGLSQSVILAALQVENRERCRPALDDKEVETIAASVARYEPDSAAVGLSGLGSDPQSWQSDLDRPSNPGPIPSELLGVPGFIGDVMAYNLAGAFKPQPALALAGALALLSVLTGRKVTDCVGTRTNLYVVGTGESGCGKERARLVNKNILYFAGLEHLMGNEEVASDSGLVSALDLQPALLFQLDELGRLLKTIANPKADHNLYHIVTTLMKLFTSSNSCFIGKAYADSKQNKRIDQPHAVVYGTTVPRSLYESLTNESITDGLLGRMIFIEGEEGKRQEPNQMAVPQGLLDAARSWEEFQPGGNLAKQHPVPVILPTDDEAAAIFARLDLFADSEQKRLGQPLGAIWTRASEKARKLALLYACSRAGKAPASNDLPTIDAAAADWAVQLAMHNTRQMIYLADRWVTDTIYEDKVKRIMRLIENGGPQGVTMTHLNNNTGLPSRDRQEIFQDIEARGLARRVTQETGGRPSTRFVAAEYLPNVIKLPVSPSESGALAL